MGPLCYERTGIEATFDEVASNVGPGWRAFLADLFEDLFAMGWDGCLASVKEVLGGLRIHLCDQCEVSEEILDRIRQAESDSHFICWECGRGGFLRNESSVRPFCDDHASTQQPLTITFSESGRVSSVSRPQGVREVRRKRLASMLNDLMV